jgi:uncharacterized membrane protein YsdA (DUF1294 family)
MTKSSPYQTFSLPAIAAVILLALVLYFLTSWSLLWIWLAAVNLVTFVAYGYDKAQARGGGDRIPEIVLHLLAVVGGFIGGWIGMFAFRHKTRKLVFKTVLALSTIGWVAALFLI